MFGKSTVAEHYHLVIDSRQANGKAYGSLREAKDAAYLLAKTRPGVLIEIWGFKRVANCKAPVSAPQHWGVDEPTPTNELFPPLAFSSTPVNDPGH